MATLKLNQGQLPTEAETTDGADAVQLQVGTFTALADAINVGSGGIGVVADPSKTGTNLRFKSINTSDGTIVVANDAINHEVLLSVEQSLIVHQSLSGAGTIDHATIDVLLPSSLQKDAMTNSNSPSSLNPFATIADIAAGAVTGGANVNTNGVGVFQDLSGGILNFRGINSLSSVLTVQLGPASGDISIDVVQSQINHTLIGNVGVNTHAQIDTHIGDLDIHGPLSDSDPVNADAGPASPGVSGSVSRADHKHDISTGTPVDIGTANAPGSGVELALANHVHNHGDLAGGTLHAEATDSVAGFMAASDKSKLNLLDADTYIFRPGGVQQGNVFTSWTDLIAATANSNGDVVIVFDDSFGTITLPTGAYSMDGVIWSGPDLANSADVTDVQVTVNLPEGFTFTNFKDVVFRNSLRVEFTGTTPPIQTAAPDQTRIFAAGNCSLVASGSGPFVRVANTVAPAGSLLIELTYGSQIINAGTEVIELVGSNSFLSLFTQVDSTVFADCISGPDGSIFVRQDASSGISSTQTNYGGSTTEINIDIAERVLFDNSGSPLTAITVQGAIDEHVNDATIHRVISSTAPVDVDAAAASAGTATETAAQDHKHSVATAAPSQGVGGGNAEGTSTSLARADHNHALRTTDGPTDLTIGAIADGEVFQRSGTSIIGATAAVASNATPPSVDATAGTAGVATDVSRSDHAHQVSTASPTQGIGSGNAEGSSANLARADHDHAIRTTDGPTDLTVGSVADGEVLQRSGTSIIGTTVAVASNATPESVDADAGSAGVATDVSRSDHTHQVSTAAPAQGIGGGNLAGTAATLARSDHNHAIRESGGTDLTVGAVADGQFLSRSGTLIEGVSLSSALVPTVFVLRPGGTESGNVYTSWASLFAAYSAEDGPRVIYFDDSLGVINIPSGSYDMTDTIWSGAGNRFVKTAVSIADGVSLPGLATIQDGLDVTYTGTTFVVTTSPQGNILFNLKNGSTISCSGSGHFFALNGTNDQLKIRVDNDSAILLNSQPVIVFLAGGSQATITLLNQSQLENDTVESAGPGTFTLTVENDATSGSDPFSQAPYLGTIVGPNDLDDSQFVAFDPSATIITATDVQGAIVEHANNSTIHTELGANVPSSVTALAGSAGVSTEASRQDHAHQVSTAAPTQGIGAGNTAGTASTLARSDHDHALRESGGTDLTIGAVADGEVLQRSGTALIGTTVAIASNSIPPAVDASAGTAGVATDVSRSDHAHQVSTGAPTQGIGGGNLAGVADTLARSDHNHAIRTTDGPTDLTVGSVADGQYFLRSGTTIIGGNPAALTGNTPQPVDGSAGSVGVGTEAARDDHTHQVSTAAPSVGIGGGNNAGVANTLARSDHNHALRETSGPTDLTIAAVADGEYLLRSGSTIISAPLSTNVFTTLVFRPGGVQAENVYTVWADLITELNNAEGQRVIQFDDSLGAISIPAGTYDMTGVIWECALEDLGSGALVTIVEGVSLPNLTQIRNGLIVRFTGTTPPVSVTTGEARFILDTGARIESTSGPFITYNFGIPSFASFDIYRGSRVTGTPEIIQIASSDVTLFIYVDERSVLEADSITGTVGQVELYISPEATTASTTQTNYTGIFGSAFQGKSSQLSYTGTALPAGNMEDTFDTHANDATIHRQISATAPVDVDAGASSAGVATETAAQDHKHSVSTAAPSQGIGGGNTAGVATTLARSDHDHTLRETGDPADLTIAAVPDGQFLQRSGSTIIGSTPIFGREASGVESTSIQTTTLTDPDGALGVGFGAGN
jgi:hypothetical protein